MFGMKDQKFTYSQVIKSMQNFNAVITGN